MLVLALAGIGSAFAAAFLVFFFGGLFSASHRSGAHLGLVALIALYPSTAVSVFFNVALACAASAAFDGEHLTAREAIRMAYGKRRQILLWSLITAIVGTMISEIANRLPAGARLVGWLFGAAWGLATIFVVPILALEGGGAVDAVKRSGRLVKQRWGEGLSGGLAIGAWSVIAAVPLAIALGIGAALLRRHPATGVVVIAVSLLGLLTVSVVVAATRQVFAVALYRYAIDAPIGGFAPSDLEYPFVPRKEKRKSWILRIGGTILALFAILVAIVAIVGPHHRHTAAEGYFVVRFGPREARELPPGTPVVFQRQVVGTITGSEGGGAIVRVEFQLKPAFSWIANNGAFIGHAGGRAYLGIRGLPRHEQSP